MDELLRVGSQVGPPGLLVMVVLMVLTDRLIPRGRYLEMKSDRDEWRNAAEKANEAVLMQARTQIHQLEIAQRTDHLVQSLPGFDGGG